MFKKLKKDRSNLLFVFLLEIILATSMLVVFIVLEDIEFIENMPHI